MTNASLRTPASAAASFRQQFLLLVFSARWSLLLLVAILVLAGVERSDAARLQRDRRWSRNA